MAWVMHKLIFKVKAPLHIGWRKTGNLMQTRPYILGRTMLGALTAAITPKARQSIEKKDYEEVWRKLYSSYFYPIVCPEKDKGDAELLSQLWKQPDVYAYRFLDAYAGTATFEVSKTAAEGTLHQVEYIRPFTRPGAGPKSQTEDSVCLVGYILLKKSDADLIEHIPPRLQVGGERSYGWGFIELVKKKEANLLWGQWKLVAETQVDEEIGPLFEALDNGENTSLALAHVRAEGATGIAEGTVEPLVAWGVNGLEYLGVFYSPGSKLKPEVRRIRMDNQGFWEAVT